LNRRKGVVSSLARSAAEGGGARRRSYAPSGRGGDCVWPATPAALETKGRAVSRFAAIKDEIQRLNWSDEVSEAFSAI
jgi:hypothetical protein